MTEAMVMPMSYVAIDEEEMTYLDGGFAISRSVFKYTCQAAVIAGCIALGGGISYAGLKAVLGSMALKSSLAAAVVKGCGMLGIALGNGFASKFISGLAGCIAGDFVGNIFDKYIDGLDGKKDGKIKIW